MSSFDEPQRALGSVWERYNGCGPEEVERALRDVERWEWAKGDTHWERPEPLWAERRGLEPSNKTVKPPKGKLGYPHHARHRGRRKAGAEVRDARRRIERELPDRLLKWASRNAPADTFALALLYSFEGPTVPPAIGAGTERERQELAGDAARVWNLPTYLLNDSKLPASIGTWWCRGRRRAGRS